MHVLALDWSDVQSQGAIKKEKKKHRLGHEAPIPTTHHSATPEQLTPGSESSLQYRTINVTSDALLQVTTDWLSGFHSHRPREEPEPLLLVALHACGSLTLDIFRTLFAKCKDLSHGRSDSDWKPAGAVIVGCCYNMLRPEGKPRVYTQVTSFINITAHTDRVLCSVSCSGLVLSPNHLQLAAQTPQQWGDTASKTAEAKLAIRKVAWRALLERIISYDADNADHISAVPNSESLAPQLEGQRRLGRLNDAIYANWSDFLTVAQQRLGITFDRLAPQERDRVLENQLSVFHVLRCILGPVVESFILLDRLEWLQNELCVSLIRLK